MRILFLAPHLSTGGMPSFLLKRIKAIQKVSNNTQISVVEYEDITGGVFVVHKNKIKKLLRTYNFKTLGAKKAQEMNHFIHDFNPDIIHVDEMLEELVDDSFLKMLYNPTRKYRIVETCHNIRFNPDEQKRYHPDLYIFCTPFHEETFADMDSPYVTITFPINFTPVNISHQQEMKKLLGMSSDRKIIVNVGLWTAGKNQGEGIEIARKYPDYDFYFVGNQAGNFQDYWEPLMHDIPSNVFVVGEKTNPEDYIIACDLFMFNSTWECNPLVIREAIGFDKPIIARNLPQYMDMFKDVLLPIDTDLNVFFTTEHSGYFNLEKSNTEQFGLEHLDAYTRILNMPPKMQKIIINQHFVEQPFLEIKGISDSTFVVEFWDGDLCYYRSECKTNTWHKLNRKYYTEWRAVVYENGNLIYDNKLDLKGKRVFIVFETESLGDTIAWMDQCDTFQLFTQCDLFVCTFWNKLFDYPNIKFVEPGSTVNSLYALYRLGWFYNEDGTPNLDRHPNIPYTIPLIQTATDILGLPYVELRPAIRGSIKGSAPIKNNYVAIATNSTLEMKFWQKDEWQKVINYLRQSGLDVINVSKERNDFVGCPQLTESTIEEAIEYIAHSSFFIGLSSGLSWIAWALNRDVYMIANFSEDWHEFDCYRFTNKNVCHGCWNKQRFNAGDWNFCPAHKNTRRAFECHHSIKAEEVIKRISNNRELMIHK